MTYYDHTDTDTDHHDHQHGNNASSIIIFVYSDDFITFMNSSIHR